MAGETLKKYVFICPRAIFRFIKVIISEIRRNEKECGITLHLTPMGHSF